MQVGDLEWHDCLSGRKEPECGHSQLDEEVPTRGEVVGGVAEALDLLVLGSQVPDRVEHQVHQRELTFDSRGGHVTDDHRDQLGWVTAQGLAFPYFLH